MTSAEAWCNKSLRPRKPEGLLGPTAHDVHLDSHTAPELWWGGENCAFHTSTKNFHVVGVCSDATYFKAGL